MSSPESIAKKVFETVTKNIADLPETAKSDLQMKFEDMKKVFVNSEATIYCEDCGAIFYYGKAFGVISEQRYVDYKMLAFRHIWDTRHKVKISLPFMVASASTLAVKNPALYAAWKHVRNTLLFDDNDQVEYFRSVESMRERLINSGQPQAYQSNDENWDYASTCICSVCGKSYHDPKRACLCHVESKSWLPMEEVNSIKVRIR
jgi:hypothetical protein